MHKITAIIPCKNEAHNIEAVLESVKWCDEILGKRGHWSTPMNTKPWYVRRGLGVDNYEFSFSQMRNKLPVLL